MRDAVRCAAALSRLGAAFVLAALASAVRDAVRCAARLSGLGAALLLAPLAPSMSDTVLCVAYSCCGAALLLAAFAPAVRLAVRRAATNSPLGAAVQLTLPPPHGTQFHAAETLLTCGTPFTAVTQPPLSPQ
jgi:hypothetical protein